MMCCASCHHHYHNRRLTIANQISDRTKQKQTSKNSQVVIKLALKASFGKKVPLIASVAAEQKET